MDTPRKIEVIILILFILFIIPLYIIGMPFLLLGHLLSSIGYLFCGDTWSAKHIWLDLFEDIKSIWNGR